MEYPLSACLCSSAENGLNTRIRFISIENTLDIGHRETLIGICNQRPDKAGVATRKIGRVKFAGYAISDISLTR